MGFLWQLLPGARETRNQLAIGYAWMATLALWFGVPVLAEGSNLDAAVDAIGRLGTAVAVSFAAFLLGSLSDDVALAVLRLRGARALSRYSRLPAFPLVEGTPDAVRGELERLEASIDRATSEVTLRTGLLPPAAAAGVYAFAEGVPWAGLVSAVAAAALTGQALRRLVDARQDIRASAELREGLEIRLSQRVDEFRIEAAKASEAARDRGQELRLQTAAGLNERMLKEVRSRIARIEESAAGAELTPEAAEELEAFRLREKMYEENVAADAREIAAAAARARDAQRRDRESARGPAERVTDTLRISDRS